MKRLLCLLLVIMLCPALALSETEMKAKKNYISFPQYDGMKGYFRGASGWTIVHQDNLEEHMARLLRRGDTEEEIRARFARDTLLWEAYSDRMPDDACIRMERFVDDVSREVWHLRHMTSAERKELMEYLNDGMLLEGYDTFAGKVQGSGKSLYIECGFTTVPPAAYESGKMRLHFINGQAYVLTYAVRGRMAGRSKLRTGKDNGLIGKYSPFNSLKFEGELLPQMPDFTLDEAFPQQVDLGDIVITGNVTRGSGMTVTLDGKKVSCAVNDKGTFRVVIPLSSAGDHEVAFTTTHSKYTDRKDTFTVNASADRTVLTVTACPEDVVLAGEHTISGVSDPGAEIILRLDEREAVTLTAGANGSFSHTYEIMDNQLHQLYLAASAQGKDISMAQAWFYTEYEAFKDGLKAFEKHLTSASVAELSADPGAHLGERVKISVRVKKVLFTEEGLGILCNYNPPKGARHDKTPLYLTLYGYAQDQIRPDMTMTIYGTVNGQKTINGEKRLEILMQYGTYLVSR